MVSLPTLAGFKKPPQRAFCQPYFALDPFPSAGLPFLEPVRSIGQVLPVHQFGVSKQPGKWLQWEDPFLWRKSRQRNNKNLLISIAQSLWCSVECKQDEKTLQYEAWHIGDYFSHYQIRLHMLSLHKWVYDDAWTPLSLTERRLHLVLTQRPPVPESCEFLFRERSNSSWFLYSVYPKSALFLYSLPPYI